MLACASLLCAAAQAADPAPAATTAGASDPANWHFSGFATLGWMQSRADQPWRFSRDLTQRGAGGDGSARTDSRLGMQVHGDLASNVEAVTQVVLKERPLNARASEYLELAFLGFRPTQNMSVRVGRTSPDLFLLADVRNVGIAYPWVRPSVEYYGWMPFSSMDGVDASAQWTLGGANWVAKLGAGQIRSTIGVVDRDTSVTLTGRDTVAAMVSREADGLLIKASFLRTRMDGRSPPAVQQLLPALDALAQLDPLPVAGEAAALREALGFGGLTRYMALGLQYDSGPWTLHAEGSRVRLERGVSGGDRGYVSASYRWNRFTGYVMAARARPEQRAMGLQTDWAAALTPVLGAAQAQQAAALGMGALYAANQARFNQSTVSLGLRWDLFDAGALKLQWDNVHVHADGTAAWRSASPSDNRAQVWSAAVDVSF
ncbi:MAG: hypothetical protein LCI02_00375 [Proteobacteria bacterium]|nr:hypothetical protein [Pseudomonadota bacterium]